MHKGVKGFVLDNETQTGIANATIAIATIAKTIVSAEGGDYWRLLNPGVYEVSHLLLHKSTPLDRRRSRSPTRTTNRRPSLPM